MNLRRFTLLTGLLAYILSSSLSAQPMFLIPDQTSDIGSSFTLSVQAATINDLAGMQFSINWDSDRLAYVSHQDFALNINQDNFGNQAVANGMLNFFWFDPTLQGVDILDTMSLFTITFQALGQTPFVDEVSFGGLPASGIEITDSALQPIDALFYNGTVEVGMISSTSEVREQGGKRLQIAPNPIRSQGTLSLHAAAPDQAWLFISDVQGRPIFSMLLSLAPGENLVPLHKSQFPSSGVYVAEVRLASGISYAHTFLID